jgi:hypothetical protein
VDCRQASETYLYTASDTCIAGHLIVTKAKKRSRKYHQGFLVSISLSDEKLSHSLLRLIPLSSIPLRDVDCMRASFFDDVFPRRNRLLRIFANRFWICTGLGGDRRLAPLYVIETREKRRRIFLRLESAFHYRVRSALGRIKSIKNFD